MLKSYKLILVIIIAEIFIITNLRLIANHLLSIGAHYGNSA